MEFPSLGKHCDLPSCQQLDFLPFKCDCGAKQKSNSVLVCPICSQPVAVSNEQTADEAVDSHINGGCTVVATSAVPRAQRCSAKMCKHKELVPIICPQCRKPFCIPHRLPKDHQCEGLSESKQHQTRLIKSERKQYIEKKVEEYLNERAKRTSTQVTLMKLKQNAKGDNRIASEKRIYLEVLFPMESKVQPKYMFFNKEWSVGKTLDCAASAANIENNNNKVGIAKLYLLSLKTGLPLPNDLQLSDLEEILKSGDAVMIERMESHSS